MEKLDSSDRHAGDQTDAVRPAWERRGHHQRSHQDGESVPHPCRAAAPRSLRVFAPREHHRMPLKLIRRSS